jgi:hypothetical protein
MALGLTTAGAHAQSWKPPAESQRCPAKWGPHDVRGSMNHQKPEAVRNATSLIKTGEVIEMAHVLNAAMPLFGTRRFDVHTKRTFMNQASNRRGSNEEILISEIGQGVKTDDIQSRGGFTRLGIETVGTIMTRGVLIDVAALKSVDALPDTYEITVQDLE